MLGNGLLASAQVLWTTAALFVVFRIVTAAAGVETLGLWSTAVAVAALAGIADCGMTDLMVRQVADARGRNLPGVAKARWLSLARFAAVAVGIACLAALPLMRRFLAPHAAELPDTSIGLLAAAAVAVAWLNVVNAGTLGVLEAFGRYDLRLGTAVLSGLAMVTSALALRSAHAGVVLPATFLAGAATTCVTALACAAFLFRGIETGRSDADGATTRALLKSGFQLRLAGITTFGLEPVTRMLMLNFAGPASVGYYEIAYRVIFQLRSMLVAALQTLVPRLAFARAAEQAGAGDLIARATLAACAIAAPVFGAALLGLPFISQFVIGRPVAEIGALSVPLALGWATNVVAAPSYFANLVENRMARNLASQSLMVAVNVLLGLVLGAWWGAVGVAVAIGAGLFAGSIVTLVQRRTEVSRGLHALVPADFVVVAGATLLVGATYFVWLSDSGSAGHLLVGASVACVLFTLSSGLLLLQRRRDFIAPGTVA